MKITKAKVKEWRDGANGFFAWIRDMKPQIPAREGGFRVFEPEPFQEEVIREALATDEHGKWKHQTIALSFPRRHSKTTIAALLVLWRFFIRGYGETIVVMANSARQADSVQFALLKKIIRNTPLLAAQMGKQDIQGLLIRNPELQNEILAMPCNASTIHGMKVSVGWVSEIHAAQDEEPAQVIASSLGDTEGSWFLADSTVDGVGGPLHRLEQLQESGEDDTVYVKRVEYADLEDALANCPPWIDRRWLKSRERTLLPATWATQHLNQRRASESNLFAVGDIQACMGLIQNPVPADQLEGLAAGRKYLTGGGLDRAFFGSVNGDATVWTTVAKIADPDDGEPHYWILNQQSITGSLSRSIKKEVQRDSTRYGLKNVIFESFNSQDVYLWAVESGIACELVHPTQQAQIGPFMELHRVVKEGRLHFSASLEGLKREMETFVYELRGDKPKFGSKQHHDDRVYSLAWAVHSLRDEELAVYELPGVICRSRSNSSHLCYLRQGDLILPCGEDCESHQRCQVMYSQHRARRVESDLTLPQFFNSMVSQKGVKMYQAL